MTDTQAQTDTQTEAGADAVTVRSPASCASWEVFVQVGVGLVDSLSKSQGPTGGASIGHGHAFRLLPWPVDPVHW